MITSCHNQHRVPQAQDEDALLWMFKVLAVCAAILFIVFTLSGCAVIYAPEARSLCLYQHNQYATNMIVNQDISDFARASASASATGAKINVTGNNIGSGNKVLAK